MAYDNEQVLIFGAKILSTYKADNDRYFLVQYYLQDKTIHVYEGKKAMSGFNGGKFLNRMKVKNPRNGKFYGDESFYVGNILEISGRTFELLDAPEYTFCLMETYPERFPPSDMQYTIESLSRYADSHGIDLDSLFENKDIIKANYLSRAEAEEILFSFAPEFPKHYSHTILRRFMITDKFDYVELLKCIHF
ncbi:hypothetical protein TRFO_20385 [Tritrichomonas foetus]|uniref:DM10 domain-containing protein n=1 Tax=Tritrichomonas foetus TaxID=1144522 RepID=A0A1J4KGK1_9EUKA|nr:hypothetical protein TRFO_20385 [Tritrichomonas foetus]|eukprot:OHT10347.1 hypothetical protein TRFO_20385 [Tritrichomonas foetus]